MQPSAHFVGTNHLGAIADADFSSLDIAVTEPNSGSYQRSANCRSISSAYWLAVGNSTNASANLVLDIILRQRMPRWV